MLEKLLKHVEQCYPEEACGLLIDGDFVPLDNVAENPEEGFEFDSAEYIKYVLESDIEAIIHSHPDGSAEPSEHDIKACNFLKIPYTILSWPEGELRTIQPGELNV